MPISAYIYRFMYLYNNVNEFMSLYVSLLESYNKAMI